MRWRLAILAVCLAGLAGCVGTSDEPAPGDANASGESIDAEPPQANRSIQPDPGEEPTDEASEQSRPSTPQFGSAVNVTTELPGAEPMLDVGPDGTVYLTGIGFSDTPVGPLFPENGLWRSTDGENWSEVAPDVPGGEEGSADNALAVGDDGTVYYATATGEAVQMFRSSDRGETWIPISSPKPPPVGHRIWLVPDGSSTVHAAVTGTVPVNDIWYHRSPDRGTTWQQLQLVHEQGGLSTDLAVGPEGTGYLARVDVEGEPAAGIAQRTGFTLYRSTGEVPAWEAVGGIEFEGAYKTSWSSLEAGPEGILYLAWGEVEGNRTLTHYAYSTDGGAEWSTPRPLAPTNGTQVMPWIDVRAPGELGLVHYETAAQGRPEGVDGEWYPEYVFVDDADTQQPRAYETRLTDWPVHEGRICTTDSQSPDCRHGASLLDFTWIEFGPEDRAHVAVASSQSEEVTAFPVYAGETSPFQPPPER